MKLKYIILILLLTMNCYSQEIILGKKYSHKDLNNFKTELTPIYEINIKNKSIFIYGEKKDERHYYDEKIFVVKDLKDNILYSEGIYLLDQDSIFSFYKDDITCAFKLKNITNRESPYNEIIVITSDAKKIYRAKVQESFIASLVVVNDKIYYTTEYSENNLKKIDMRTGEQSELKFRFPNARLITTGDLIIGKTIDSKVFYIKNDEIIFVDDEISKNKNGIMQYRR